MLSAKEANQKTKDFNSKENSDVLQSIEKLIYEAIEKNQYTILFETTGDNLNYYVRRSLENLGFDVQCSPPFRGDKWCNHISWYDNILEKETN